ncbi:hypothetical protein P9139_08705 [Curtobacterium flaccumfaciens]|nr:hypothetical protein P9139_08705 [Curtobacterium flaccumfaciens]
MHSTPTVAEPVTVDGRRDGRRRFARVGRVVPVALLQIVGTLVASRFATGPTGPGPTAARPGRGTRSPTGSIPSSSARSRSRCSWPASSRSRGGGGGPGRSSS